MGLRLLGLAEVSYMTYHLDWTNFLFAHTVSEVLDLGRLHPRLRSRDAARARGPPVPSTADHVRAPAPGARPFPPRDARPRRGGSSPDVPAGRPPASPVATTTVDLPKSYKFVPARITVPAGSTVTWTNNDDFTHNVTLPDGPEPLTDGAWGSSVTYTFSNRPAPSRTCAPSTPRT